MTRWLLFFVLLASTAHAQAPTAPPAASSEPTPDARQQAREAFARAIALSDQKRPQEALVELERAYQLSPHFAVLYNLGKTYAALAMPIEAIEALERYLREGGERIDAARRAHVQALIDIERSRVATLTLAVEPAGAEVSIDGRAIGKAPLGEALPIAAGAHDVRVALDGYLPFVQRIDLAQQQQALVHVQLVHEGRGVAERGLLALRCELPDVRIDWGGRTLETTPLRAPLALPPGRHTLALSRSGYRAQQLAVDVRSGQLTQAACALSPATPLAADAGQISILVSEPDAAIAIDGVRMPPATRLPPGRHVVEVSRSGFVPHVEQVTLGARAALNVHADLKPEPAYRRDYEARARDQRVWSLVLGSAGIALTGVATGLLIWNETRYADWRDEDRALTRALESGEGDLGDLQSRQAANNDAITSIQRWEVAAAATGVAGLLLGAAGVVLFVTGDDPDRYQALEVKAAPGTIALLARGTL